MKILHSFGSCAYKTAKPKGDDDPFLPIYETQLWGYAQLAQHYRLGEVSSAALIYFGNTLKDFENKPLDLLTKKGMQVPFEVKTHVVDVDLNGLASLLKEFRKYADLESLPDGIDGCKNCERSKRLVEIFHSDNARQKLINDLWNRDRVSLNMILNQRTADRRRSLVDASRNWEVDLEDALSNNFEFEPDPLDS